ncbi:MAG: ABC transporter permease subunit [Candidatus Dadabacteria bacterium]|nr:MAG: ABC transporter permease subunit [Candidatus Dadabacteria bacterium]
MPAPQQLAKTIDRMAAWVIRLGGMMVIAAIIGIFLEIFGVTLPLFGGASHDVASERPLSERTDDAPVAVEPDDYLSSAWLIRRSGQATWTAVTDSAYTQSVSLAATTDAVVTHVNRYGTDAWSVAWSDGTISAHRLRFLARFDDDGKRYIVPDFETITHRATFARQCDNPALHVLRATDERVVELCISGQELYWALVEQTENLWGDVELTETSGTTTLDARPVALLPDNAGDRFDIVYDTGRLQRYELGDGELNLWSDTDTPATGRIAAAAHLLGDYTVLLGFDDGRVEAWFPVRDPADPGRRIFRRIHELNRHDDAVQAFHAFPNNKSLLSVGSAGDMLLQHATSERLLDRIDAPRDAVIGINRRGDGIALATTDKLQIVRVHNPHPETSFGTLFGKVWYEGYDEPAWVWQSSSGSADFEPKFSLIPLIVGTLKATLYALLFSIPIALLAAIYANQFLSPKLHGAVKPVVELMAAFPSVVVGFLAALWLAPYVERHLLAFFVSIPVVGLLLTLWLVFWRYAIVPRNLAWTRKRGTELALLLPVVLLGLWLSGQIAAPMQAHLFGGNFIQWMYDSFGIRYDQRNSIIIAVGLGFAVIPIIFTIADDALGNVPRSLSAASLALGASRWQTVWKIVVPSASPGIFAAVMIGMGRAVGETMIVLMAAGNTPILDWSLFNGMRTLSANIAVEIPEAPHGGTLYRILFLSALLLFAFTFVLNTVAELVRERLRKKYGRF